MAKLQIDFFSVSTGINVTFDAFVTAFSDTYNVGWTESEAFGRMDPIATYKGTKRSIACTFTIPAANDEEIVANHVKFQRLLSLMYPNYDVDTITKNATIASVPLFKVKYANLIYDFSLSNTYGSQTAREHGLLGYFTSFKFDPNNDSQVLVKDGAVYYQSLNCAFDFKPLHTARLGRNTRDLTNISRESNFGQAFPYGSDKLPIQPQEPAEAVAATSISPAPPASNFTPASTFATLPPVEQGAFFNSLSEQGRADFIQRFTNDEAAGSTDYTNYDFSSYNTVPNTVPFSPIDIRKTR